MKSDFWWYVARSGGFVAWALCGASLAWGLTLDPRKLGRLAYRMRQRRHRFLSLLAVAFVAVHAVGLVLQAGLGIGVVDVLVPFAADDDAASLALGVVASYLALAVGVTVFLRSRVNDRGWRLVHVAALAAFVLGTVHGLKVGTDFDRAAVWWPITVVAAAVVGFAAYKILATDEEAPEPETAAPADRAVTTAVLERTLAELKRYEPRPAAPSHPSVAAPTPGTTPPAPRPPAAASTPPAPPAPPAPPVAPASPTTAPATGRSSEPMFPDLATPAAAWQPATSQPATRQPPVPSRAPADGAAPSPLPTRVPRRLAATTAPASSLGAWRPSSSRPSGRSGPPPPPENAIDPRTGEPDPQVYRRWLREWLEYVESQP
ncbi:MAG TPA: hypothetical protein VF183_08495 [Acidimicrobiales bacterium]